MTYVIESMYIHIYIYICVYACVFACVYVCVCECVCTHDILKWYHLVLCVYGMASK